jgi:hypothetical protein
MWRRVVGEVHRRSLWQVLGIYLVTGWVAIQVMLSMHEALGLPDWVPPFTIRRRLVALRGPG